MAHKPSGGELNSRRNPRGALSKTIPVYAFTTKARCAQHQRSMASNYHLQWKFTLVGLKTSKVKSPTVITPLAGSIIVMSHCRTLYNKLYKTNYITTW